MPRHSVTLRLPDGASAVVTLDEARTLERRLWAVGFAPGAAAAAGKLADSTSSWVHDPQRVDFNRREATPVVAAGSWITWTNRSFDV